MSNHTTTCSCCSSREISESSKNNDNRKNIIDNPDHPLITPSKKISTVSGYEVQRLIHKINRVKAFLPTIQSIPVLDYSKHNEERCNILNDNPPKHVGQIESIVAHMQRNGLLPPPSTTQSRFHDEYDGKKDSDTTTPAGHYYFIEFGCGTAKLSDHVSSTIVQQLQQQQQQQQKGATLYGDATTAAPIHYVLIDQQPMKAVERYCDGRIRSRHHHPFRMNETSRDIVQRHTCPISQVRLNDIIHHHEATDLPSASTSTTTKQKLTVVAMAKHLCGSATDDAIRCIQNYCKEEMKQTLKGTANSTTMYDDNYQNNERSIARIPLVIATCCHYACDAQTLLDYKISIPAAVKEEALLPGTDHNIDHQLSYLQYMGFDERDIEVLIIVSQWASIKIDVAVDVPDTDDESAVRVAEQQKVSSTRTERVSSIFHDKLDKIDGDTMSPDRDEMTFPPPLPPSPIPITIQPAIENDMRLSSQSFEVQFSRPEKQELGQYSKLLIDMARGYYLKYNNISPYQAVKLIYYTTLSVERHLLIAT